ncbi:hypothetical protein GCM10009105_36430 [Dokdonella soli]|uniref:PKD domain-containing protein n=1 Tax=Dokdonella soli TaxID=529810 RepID=A0ABP3U4K9_9GAMM
MLLIALPGWAGATVITASPVNFASGEGAVFNGAVATFIDDDPAATPSSFTASIDWGDGSAVTSGTIAVSSAAFTVLGQHTYADEGTFTATVTISDQPPGTGTATATDSAIISERDVLTGSPVTFAAAPGVSFTTSVATFSDTLSTATVGDFTATINWGDATTTAGTVSGSAGSFQVSGTHTYAGSGTFSVSVTLSDDAPGTATASVTSTAHVLSSLTATPVNFSVNEHASFNGTVATFLDPDPSKTASSFTSTINWGDGTTTAGTVAGAAGAFTLKGQHTYADEGSFPVGITISEVAPGTATTSVTATATVAEADVLTPAPVTFAAVVGTSFTGKVATFTDADAANVASDFSATVNWGDGTTSAGTISGSAGAFQVSATHTYAASGPFTVAVTIADDAPGTASARVTSTANVAAAPPPPPVEPLPMLDIRGLLVLVLALGVAGAALARQR